MSFTSLLTHELVVIRTPMDDTIAARTEYGMPRAGAPIETAVNGLVQPRSAEEMASAASAGAEIADHKIFLPPMDLQASDTIRYAGERYSIKGIRRFAYGSVPHLEVEALRVGPITENVLVEGS